MTVVNALLRRALSEISKHFPSLFQLSAKLDTDDKRIREIRIENRFDLLISFRNP